MVAEKHFTLLLLGNHSRCLSSCTYLQMRGTYDASVLLDRQIYKHVFNASECVVCVCVVQFKWHRKILPNNTYTKCIRSKYMASSWLIIIIMLLLLLFEKFYHFSEKSTLMLRCKKFVISIVFVSTQVTVAAFNRFRLNIDYRDVDKNSKKHNIRKKKRERRITHV